MIKSIISSYKEKYYLSIFGFFLVSFSSQDEDLGYLLWAFDDDKGENASLSYRVVSTFRPPSGEEVDLFYAVNENVTDVTSCRLVLFSSLSLKSVSAKK